jgi:preprotein translocase SecF subunit
MRFFKDPKYNFMEVRKYTFILSAVVLGLGIISLIAHGGPELSIDFLGGSMIQVKFDRPIPLGEVRSALAELDTLNLGSYDLQNFGGDDEILIRVARFTSGESMGPVIESVLTDNFPEAAVSIEREESVGPKIGRALERKALLAIFYSLLGILIYISWRFEFRFAVAAIIALFHDVLLTVSAFSITGKEISLAVMAAILTIIGYSLNDTIVIFDRIRENRRVLRRQSFTEIINTSINQSINRTINTSMTTLLVVLMLFIYGGGIIHDFAFALLVGVIVGTYSSTFIASPVLVEWQNRAAAKTRDKGR